MSTVVPQRMTTEIDGDSVVFLIGMRVNRWWKVHKWLPVMRAMPRMLAELRKDPSSGFLGSIFGPGVIVQYWRSFDHLERHARSHDHEHWPDWVAFNKKVRTSSGDVGIWHETYMVKAGQYEAVYGAMPRHGLAAAGRHVPVTHAGDGARQRVQGER